MVRRLEYGATGRARYRGHVLSFVMATADSGWDATDRVDTAASTAAVRPR